MRSLANQSVFTLLFIEAIYAMLDEDRTRSDVRRPLLFRLGLALPFRPVIFWNALSRSYRVFRRRENGL